MVCVCVSVCVGVWVGVCVCECVCVCVCVSVCTDLFFVGCLKVAVLHQTLIWAESRVGGCHALFWFIQGTSELREAIDELVARSEMER